MNVLKLLVVLFWLVRVLFVVAPEIPDVIVVGLEPAPTIQMVVGGGEPARDGAMPSTKKARLDPRAVPARSAG